MTSATVGSYKVTSWPRQDESIWDIFVYTTILGEPPPATLEKEVIEGIIIVYDHDLEERQKTSNNE